MAKSRKQEINTGSTDGKAPILASEKPSTGEELKPSPASIEHAQSDTKPLSPAEALSLWQTACFDLQSQGFKVAILARDNRVYLIAQPPASIGKLTFEGGHIRLNGLPVSDL